MMRQLGLSSTPRITMTLSRPENSSVPPLPAAAAGLASSARPISSGQRRIDRLAGLQQLLHRFDRDFEIGLGGVIELDLDDALHPAVADDDRNPHIEAVDAVLALEIGG